MRNINLNKEEKENRLKNLVEYNIGGIWGEDLKNNDEKTIVLRVADFNKNAMTISDEKLTFRKINQNELFTRKLKKGDILIEKSGGGATSPVGNVVIFNKNYKHDAVFSNFTNLLRFNNKKVYEKFIIYFLKSIYDSGKIKESIKQNTGIQNLDIQHYLSNNKIVLPSIEKQKNIADLLDDKVGDITALIHTIDGQIENLKDYKKSLLKSTVGKLFELDDGYKTRLKNLVEYNIGGVWGNDVKNDDHKIVVVRVSDFDKEKMNIKDSNLTFREITNNEVESRKLKKGDILVEKSGGGATSPVGNMVLFDKDYDAVFSNFTTLLRFDDKKCDSNFMKFVLKYIYDSGKVKKSIKQNTGIQNLDMQHYLSNELSLPEKNRQSEIANTLSEQYKIIDEAIKKAKKQKQNLIDYKKVLINDVVTGKIKVYKEELN